VFNFNDEDTKMKDVDFLIWIHERLENVHGENPYTDYMNKLRSIIAAMPQNQYTPNVTTFNGVGELVKHLDVVRNTENPPYALNGGDLEDELACS